MDRTALRTPIGRLRGKRELARSVRRRRRRRLGCETGSDSSHLGCWVARTRNVRSRSMSGRANDRGRLLLHIIISSQKRGIGQCRHADSAWSQLLALPAAAAAATTTTMTTQVRVVAIRSSHEARGGNRFHKWGDFNQGCGDGSPHLNPTETEVGVHRAEA